MPYSVRTDSMALRRMAMIRTHVRVFYKGKELSMKECIKAAGFDMTADEMVNRLKGNHCNCGYNLGEFDLLPEDSEEVLCGGKRYMVCRKCGCISHL